MTTKFSDSYYKYVNLKEIRLTFRGIKSQTSLHMWPVWNLCARTFEFINEKKGYDIVGIYLTVLAWIQQSSGRGELELSKTSLVWHTHYT